TRWMSPSRTILIAQMTVVLTVIRLRFRSATPELPAPLDIPPPNMSERPPPRPLCMSTRGMASRLVVMSTTMHAVRRKSTEVPFLVRSATPLSAPQSRIGDGSRPDLTPRASRPAHRAGREATGRARASQPDGVRLEASDLGELLGVEARPAD